VFSHYTYHNQWHEISSIDGWTCVKQIVVVKTCAEKDRKTNHAFCDRIVCIHWCIHVHKKRHVHARWKHETYRWCSLRECKTHRWYVVLVSFLIGILLHHLKFLPCFTWY
jgi:hypothetical protein